MLELYERIRKRRKELGMTQAELAQKLGYRSRSSIQKIEKGENDIPQSKIVAFAEALNTTPENLMGWNSPKTNTKTASDEHIELVDGYDSLPDEGKILVMGMIRQLKSSKKSSRQSSLKNSSVKITNNLKNTNGNNYVNNF